ncbi:MAG: hypothetical protein QM775_00675 [Pirellulales bacterium]
MNVVVEKKQIPLDQKTLDELADFLPQQFKQVGADCTIIRKSLQKYGANQAGILEYDARLPGIPMPLKQRQVYFVGGGKTFIVTCTATAGTFTKYAPTFDAMLASFEVPEPVGFNWSKVLAGGSRGAIIGGLVGLAAGLIGGGVALMKKLSGGKRPKTPEPPLNFPQFPQA